MTYFAWSTSCSGCVTAIPLTTRRTQERPSAGKRCINSLLLGLSFSIPTIQIDRLTRTAATRSLRPRSNSYRAVEPHSTLGASARIYSRLLVYRRAMQRRGSSLAFRSRFSTDRLYTLHPGGQNVLLKAILEEFCPRWTPGGKVLYVGDAGKDDPVLDVMGLSALRIDLDKHGKLPDLIVYMPDRNWLVLLEAASSHGPVDAKRHAELKTLLGSSSAGLVYVICFSSRAEMRKYLTDIAWETDAWCAEDPTHLIHFNGERFLGPYDPSDGTPKDQTARRS